MPRVVDYDEVLSRLTAEGFDSLYPRSGAFGVPHPDKAVSIGWLLTHDPTLREMALPLAHYVEPATIESLIERFTTAWISFLPGPIWLMPKSHWAYELQFGSAAWLPEALAAAGVNAASLADRADGSAVEFQSGESQSASLLLATLLANLSASDFLAAFPSRASVCTIHSHRQLWWTTSDFSVASRLASLTQS